ncbi:4576_t:CDS:2 [Diversispora eburnea]|uniref:4576_t:CDS:1 n=1 Tax=Diversispora eburnea TaxID=1213867 RepID=A0A9N8ZS00_9GLOM|nr:4576_t:CDS:2 [Diversispora eburnea]
MESLQVDSLFSKYVVQRMKDMLNEKDLNKMIENQDQIYQSLESSTSSVISFNEFSASKYNELAKKFESHSKCIKEMKE